MHFQTFGQRYLPTTIYIILIDCVAINGVTTSDRQFQFWLLQTKARLNSDLVVRHGKQGGKLFFWNHNKFNT